MRAFPRLRFLLPLLAAAVSFLNVESPAQKAKASAAAARRQPAAAAAPRLVIQYGHAEPVDAAAFSRDGRYAATGSWSEETAVLWDLEAGAEIRRFAGNERGGAQDGYMAVALSPDNRLVAASSETGVRVFDVATGRVVRHLKSANTGSEVIFINLDFSEDGARLTFGPDVFELATGRVVGRAEMRGELARFDVATPDGSRIVEMTYTPEAGPGGAEVYAAIVKEAKTGRVVGRLGGHGDRIHALAISPDGRTVITGTDSRERALRVWDVETATERHRLRNHARPGTTNFAGGGIVNAFSEGGEVRLRDWATGRETVLRVGEGERAGAAAVSSDGRRAVVVVGSETRVYDTLTGGLVSRFPAPEESLTTRRDRPHFSPDGRFVVGLNCHSCATALDEAETGRRLRTFKCNAGNPCLTAFSRDGRLAAVSNSDATGGAGHVEIVSTAEGRPLSRTRPSKDDYLEINALAFSPDARLLVAAGSDYTSVQGAQVKIWDVATGRAVRELKGHEMFIYAVAWSPDGRLVATASADGTARLWDARTGKEERRLAGHNAPVREVQFSPDGRLVLTRGLDNAARLYEAGTGRAVAHMVNFDSGDWVVADAEGRFDTNNPEGLRGLHWVSPDDPLRTLPLEIFMRDYYEPRLLARLLAGERFAPVRSLADLNRAQPSVRITDIRRRDGDGATADVTVEVAKPVTESGGGADPAGVYDLRLFRDGQLVSHAPDGGGRLALDARTGRASHTFRNVRLPRAAEARELTFSAYAFNEDRVKSATDRRALRLEASALPARGRVYLVSVGVNAYENEEWDLRFAANDARRLQEVVAARVARTGEYEEVVSVPLISDYETEAGRKTSPRVVKESAATKANFKMVLDLLAGREVDAARRRAVPNADRLRAATPEDLVLVSFSSHGYADGRGNFYLLTSDTGAGGSKREALARAVSSDELSAWLRDVDAGELVLVVDACHSAASVEGEGFRPGPMGSRGLGQLSYDKGMRVLTSTQADDVALESRLVEQGLLTYALTRDGLEAMRADFRPADRRVTVSEWLAYGVERVPALHAEVARRLSEMRQGSAHPAPLAGDTQTKVVTFNPHRKRPPRRAPAGAKGLTVIADAARTQQPALFDFSRRRRDAVLAAAQ
ncbi:MAG TPA: hypothetical protein VG148_17205 [Pyrinomonadaceae bacterium]|nr:hypothetical protein [Pyrinomonadaceae bacterium]